MAKKPTPRTGHGIAAMDSPALSGKHRKDEVEPDAHGNREQRRAWARKYGKTAEPEAQP